MIKIALNFTVKETFSPRGDILPLLVFKRKRRRLTK